MSITTTAAVKAYAGISGSDDDALLTSLIAACEKAAESLSLGRLVAAANFTDQYDGTGRDTLVLKRRPVNTVTEIKFDDDWGFGADIEALETSKFRLDNGIVHLRCLVFPVGTGNVRVKGNAGYATWPADVEQAANVVVADWYARAKRLAVGLEQNELAGGSTGDRSHSYQKETTEWGVPIYAKAIFERYAPLW